MGPIVFVSHNRVKEGKLEAFLPLLRQATKTLQDEKPQTLVYLAYLDDGSRLTIFHMFADEKAMDLHWEGVDARSQVAYEFIQPEGFEIYGTPSDRVREQMTRWAAAAGVPLRLDTRHLGGYIRPAAG